MSPCFKYCTENTCDNLLNPVSPENCTIPCDYNICACKDGLYRNACNKCVKKEECYSSTPCQLYQPLVCPGENEELLGCFDPTMAKVCPNVRCSKPRDLFFQSEKDCQTGLCAMNVCECIDGYLRNKCGKCVLAADCFKKCHIGKHDPCSQTNEVRLAKRKSSTKSCKSRRRSPFSYKRQKNKNVCVCQDGTSRDHCRECVPPEMHHFKGACLHTDPCAYIHIEMPVYHVEWQCLNSCTQRDCRSMYNFKNRTTPCPTECFFTCQCSANKNLWYNGTACVTAEECPPYDQTYDFSKATPTHLENLSPGWVSDFRSGKIDS